MHLGAVCFISLSTEEQRIFSQHCHPVWGERPAREELDSSEEGERSARTCEGEISGPSFLSFVPAVRWELLPDLSNSLPFQIQLTFLRKSWTLWWGSELDSQFCKSLVLQSDCLCDLQIRHVWAPFLVRPRGCPQPL